MKTIKVTDEMYEFLMDLSKELNTQDHRCTAMPYIFQVREVEEIPAHEYCGDREVLYSSAHESELIDLEDKIEFIKDYEIENVFYEEEIEDIDNQDEYTVDQILIEEGFEKYYVQDHYTYSNAFLTSKACDEHIRVNKHNLKQPVNYLSGAFRNQELEKVFQFLCELSGGKLHK